MERKPMGLGDLFQACGVMVMTYENDKKALALAGLGMLWQDTYRQLSGPSLNFRKIAAIQQKLADIDMARAMIDEMPSLEEYAHLVKRHAHCHDTHAALEALVRCLEQDRRAMLYDNWAEPLEAAKRALTPR